MDSSTSSSPCVRSSTWGPGITLGIFDVVSSIGNLVAVDCCEDSLSDFDSWTFDSSSVISSADNLLTKFPFVTAFNSSLVKKNLDFLGSLWSRT